MRLLKTPSCAFRQMVAPDLPTQDLVRLVLSELQDRQLSLSRMTEIWAKRNATNEELGLAKIIVVLQSDGVQDAALIFHMNERFIRYSWNRQGLRCQEPRPERHTNASRNERPADWNIEDLWGKRCADQMDQRERIKRNNGLHQGQQWGSLNSIPPETPLYQISDF